MELNIPDLLDGLQDESVPIRPCTQSSRDRIKELTMKKIHKYEKPRGRGLSFVTKVLVAAIIITSLAIPVMAATGFQLTDWLEGLNKPDREGWKTHYESWEKTEGFWQVSMTARNLTREGMTLSVREAQDTPVTGKLEIHEGYWLEHWDGVAFEKMTAAFEARAGENREIRDGDEFEIAVNWTSAYGALESGRYRLVKEFTYTYSDGKTAKLTEWAEFRIFNEDMTPYIEQCKVALDELLNREHSHIFLELYSYGKGPEDMTDKYGYTIWRSGDKYLMANLHHDYLYKWSSHRGELLLGNEGYWIDSWINDDVMQGVKDWEYDHLLAPDLNQFDLWHFCLAFTDSNVGEIWVEENTITLTCAEYPEPDIAKYSEYIFGFDDAGNLVSGERWYLPEPNCAQEEKWISCKMTVHDTSPEDIVNVIEAQKVGTPAPFSWAQEKEAAMEKRGAVITSGFNNTTPVTIESGYDAYMQGFGDYDVPGETHHTSKVSYDSNADMWKVEYMWANGNIHASIYMNSDGITQLVVTEDYE